MNPFNAAQAHPGLDFFQSLLKGSGMSSGFASWMAPTLDPDELERKIVDLRAVLQWLEANVRLTQATIQALEVQRMTLSTLKTMNVDLGDLAGQMGEAMRAGAQALGATAGGAAGGGDASSRPAPSSAAAADEAQQEQAMPGLIDPMQWWGAISEQFGKLAADALRETAWPNAAQPATAAPAAQAAPARAGAAARKRGGAAATRKPAAKAARKRSPAAG